MELGERSLGRSESGAHLMLLTGALILNACAFQRAENTEPLFERIPPEHSKIDFVNELREDDILNVVSFEGFYNGAGVAIGDFNNDGLQDVFFSSNQGRNRLYYNEGNFKFRDVTVESGIHDNGRWANGVALVDINGDGFLDIYVSNGGPFVDPEMRANELYINNGNGTFAERAAEYGLDDTGITIQTVFFDYDRDGDLDAYLLTNGSDDVPPNVIRSKKLHGESVTTDRLYRNDGNGVFTDVSEEAGISIEGHGLGILVADFNLDGWPDIYAANDYLSNDLIYINNRDGTFSNRIAEIFRHQSFAAMGADMADINSDGLPDLMTADMLAPTNAGIKRMYGDAGYERRRAEELAGYERQVTRNTLQLNLGFPGGRELPVFSEIGLLAGVESTNWSWSVLFGDYDNDGRKDILVTNGIPRDITNQDFAEYKMRELRRSGAGPAVIAHLAAELRGIPGIQDENFFFRNEGDLSFTDVSRQWGFDRPSYSTGAAYADLDNDGDLDLILSNQNEVAAVYRNRARERGSGNYLQVELLGPEQNRQGLGAHVILYEKDSVQHHEHTPYRGYLSTVGSPIHFGIGASSTVDSLVVIWPDDRRQTLPAVPANQRLTVRYQDSIAPKLPSGSAGTALRLAALTGDPAGTEPLVTDVTREVRVSFQHSEQHYNDFKLQPLLPHKYSHIGPPLAVGDVNADGLDDIFVGGAFEQSGQIFLQRKDGTFHSDRNDGDLVTQASGGKYYEEDTGALFFDANGDGFLDLYVASGGSEFEDGSPYYQDRLYINDGNGRFVHDPDALPEIRTSTSAVAAADFDGDGDLDLFVGGRVVPNRYPEAPRSYLLENRGGKFVDVTRSLAPDLYTPGLVTSATWTDVDNDGQVDLVIAGEWMPITIFRNENGRLVDVTQEAGTAETVGWWSSLLAADFDGDGDIDFVIGNLGRNTNLRNTPAGPVRLYVNDFNRDRRPDPILTRYIGGSSYPVHLRDDLLDHLPHLLPRIPTHQAYATLAFAGLFSPDELEGAIVHEIDYFESSYLENQGSGKFAVRPLPVEAQFAPVFGMTATDFNGDGHLDIVMVGNSSANEAFIGPYDAFSGLILLGDGTGNFAPLPSARSGFYLDGDGRAIATLLGADGARMIVATQNDAEVRIFRAGSANQIAEFRSE